MKKFLFLFLAVSLAFVSCDKDDEDDFDTDNIIGSWECSRVEINDVYDETASATMSVLKPKYTFNEDGTGTETNLFGSNDITWTLTTAKVLTINHGSDPDNYTLDELNSSKFVYSTTDDNSTTLKVTYSKK